MKIRPVILCGGSGTRLWPESKLNKAKQFIDFGGWCLFEKALERVKDPMFDYPIISTNGKYLKDVKKYLKKLKIKNFKIILEPKKKNTAPAILSASLINEIPYNQPLIYFSADHLIENFDLFKKVLIKNTNKLSSSNISIFGIKPTAPSSEYGYFLTKYKNKKNTVSSFIEKPNTSKAKKIIQKKGLWNSGMFFLRKDSIINNFKEYQPKIFKNCSKALINAKYKNNIYNLNKYFFKLAPSKSFDHAILEKTKKIIGIKIDLPWSDLGSWKEILKMYDKKKSMFYRSENVYFRPWGKYINIFRGKGFLIKELTIKKKGCLSLQKHFHRSEHWLITKGVPKITLNKKEFFRKKNQSIEIPKGAIHRIQNNFKEPVKIIEAQLGNILKETDIVRFEDIYGRIR